MKKDTIVDYKKLLQMVFVLHNRRLLTKNLTKLGYQLEDMQFSTMVVYIIHLLYNAI